MRQKMAVLLNIRKSKLSYSFFVNLGQLLGSSCSVLIHLHRGASPPIIRHPPGGATSGGAAVRCPSGARATRVQRDLPCRLPTRPPGGATGSTRRPGTGTPRRAPSRHPNQKPRKQGEEWPAWRPTRPGWVNRRLGAPPQETMMTRASAGPGRGSQQTLRAGPRERRRSRRVGGGGRPIGQQRGSCPVPTWPRSGRPPPR